MSTQPAQDRAADAAFLSKLTLYVREHPREFQRGTALLGRRFSVAAARKREAYEARGFRNAYPRASPIWRDTLDRLRRYRTECAKGMPAMRLGLWEAEAWVRTSPDVMDRDEAEAVCLVVVCLFDNNPEQNSALPDELRSIPWGGIDDLTGKWTNGRWFRADSLGLDRELLERARVAWARIESWGAAFPDEAEEPGKAGRSLHAGHELAMAALVELHRLAPQVRGSTQRQQHEALRRLHQEGRLTTYRGVRLPRESAFWRYVREVRRAHGLGQADQPDDIRPR